MWKKTPDRYRRHYYFGEQFPSTKEMQFGSLVAHLSEVEPDHPLVNDIPKLAKREHTIVADVDGVNVMAKMDSYADGVIRDTKTGKIPWTALRMRQLGQLPFYAVVVHQVYGIEQVTVNIDWVPTCEVETGPFSRIERTGGPVVSFTRIVELQEIQYWRTKIIEAAQEISEDYQRTLNF